MCRRQRDDGHVVATLNGGIQAQLSDGIGDVDAQLIAVDDVRLRQHHDAKSEAVPDYHLLDIE